MAYSTIKKKRCKCGCNKFTKLGYDGYAYSCAPADVKERVKVKTRKQVRAAKQRLQNKVFNLRPLDEAAIKLALWFRLKIHSSKKVCENCGKYLDYYNEDDWRGSQHHIVEKALCPSVAANPYNHLVLGMWCCHHLWHQSFAAASKLSVFAKAKAKFKLFVNDIAPDELKKVNPFLFDVQAADPSGISQQYEEKNN